MTIGTTTGGEPITAAITPTSHALINHAGLPGIPTATASVIDVTTGYGASALVIAVPANTLTQNEDFLEFEFWGDSGNAVGPTLTITWAGSSVCTLLIPSGTKVWAAGKIVRTSISNAETSAFIMPNGSSQAVNRNGIATTWTNPNNLSFTWAGGMNETSNVVIKKFRV